MNKDRRKQIDKALGLLQQIVPLLDELKPIVEQVAGEEREFYETMPENMQSGDKGQQADAAATYLEDASTVLEELDIEDLIAKLEDAKS